MNQNRPIQPPEDPHRAEKAEHLRQNEAWLAFWHGLETLTADELAAFESPTGADYEDEHPSQAA